MAVDDFGTGYSSMVNLKQFPLLRLTIDRPFVRDVSRDSNDEAIIRATIALGRSFNLRITAEGVENEAQRDFLLKEGCHEVQGYLYSEPVLPERISDRPPMKDRVANKRLAKALITTAANWDIDLVSGSSLWPSVGGLVTGKTAVVCGLGPVARDINTPREAVQRISLVQRTIVLAQFLLGLEA